MDIYSVTKEFSAPQLGVHLNVLDTVGKLATRVETLIGATEYPCKAFYDWVGTPDSLNYLAFIGTVPDPVTPGGGGVGGTFPIPDGADEVTVVGGAFGFVPTSVVCIVWKPAPPGSNIFATVRAGTITADGFIADLQGPTPAPGYLLSYVVTA